MPQDSNHYLVVTVITQMEMLVNVYKPYMLKNIIRPLQTMNNSQVASRVYSRELI